MMATWTVADMALVSVTWVMSGHLLREVTSCPGRNNQKQNQTTFFFFGSVN